MTTALRQCAPDSLEEPWGLLGNHPLMVRLRDEIRRAARAHLSVVLVGETGTGKELAARAIHAESGSRGHLVTFIGGALSDQLAEAELFGTVRGGFTGAVDRPGLLEAADGGTVYLDEATDLTPGLQLHLLRALEYRLVRRVGGRLEYPVRFRLVLSVQEAIAELVQRGRWREDFGYRVDGITLHLPPLRSRAEDIPLLAAHALRGLGREPLGAAALRFLQAHHWPGNVRQLFRILERAAFAARESTIGVHHLETELGAPLPAGARESKSVAQQEGDAARRFMERILREAPTAQVAASELGLSLHQVYRRMRALGIRPPNRR